VSESLLATPVAPSPPPLNATNTAVTRPVNKMAMVSLVLSCIAFIVPLGVAAIVMGHMSRAQIGRSGGKQSGAGLAFAGLILSYLQLASMLILGVGLLSVWHRMNQELDKNPFARAALTEQLLHGGTPSAGENRRHTIDALRLIHARETEYLAQHPNEGYTCELAKLASYADHDELSMHLASSHYLIDIHQCRGWDDQRFAAVAIPRSDSNPRGAPVYCVDQTGVIRASDGDWLNDENRILIVERKSCPESGQPVQ